MPEPYGDLELDIPKGKGETPNAPQAFKDYTDSLGEALTAPKGQLFIAQNGDIAKFVAMKGDATLAEDGTLTIADSVVTSRKLKPTTGQVKATGNLEPLGGAPTLVPGAKREITPAVASVILIQAVFDLAVKGEGALAIGGIYVDGALAGEVVLAPGSSGSNLQGRGTVAQVAQVALTAAKHTIELQASATGAPAPTNTAAYSDRTRFTFQLFAS